MPIKQKGSDEFGYYVDNLLFNHDIELLSQFVKDMSFEKKERFCLFHGRRFQGEDRFFSQY